MQAKVWASVGLRVGALGLAASGILPQHPRQRHLHHRFATPRWLRTLQTRAALTSTTATLPTQISLDCATTKMRRRSSMPASPPPRPLLLTWLECRRSKCWLRTRCLYGMPTYVNKKTLPRCPLHVGGFEHFTSPLSRSHSAMGFMLTCAVPMTRNNEGSFGGSQRISAATDARRPFC